MADEENTKPGEFDKQNSSFDDIPKKSDKTSFPVIAGVILIIAGTLALISFVQVLFVDVNTIESVMDFAQIQTSDVNLTSAQVKEFMNTCAIVGCIISVLTLLGGILSYRKKLWGMALSCSIIGLFSLGPMFVSSILSFIALILIAFSKQEFQ